MKQTKEKRKRIKQHSMATEFKRIKQHSMATELSTP
jgi:hypothetical protein